MSHFRSFPLLSSDRFRLGIAAVLLLLAAACGPTSGSANQSTSEPQPSVTAVADDRIQVISEVSVSYYSVFGNSTQQLFDYMTYYGPVTAEGERAVGLATAKPRREWRPETNGSACAIGSMTINVEISLTLPKLDPSSRLNIATTQNWNRFAADVEAHERRHVDIYLEGFEEMRKLMEAIGQKESCAAVEAEVRRVWDSHLAVINQRQERFHDEEDARVERQREPVRRQIEANQLRLNSLSDEIAALEASIRDISARTEQLDRELDTLKRRLDAIAARYPNLILPEPTYTEYQELKALYNDRVPLYNQLVQQFDAASRQRQAAIAEHNRIANLTSQLVEDYNWIQ